MIISGFPCIGKTTCSEYRYDVIDLESSVFCKNNFEQYVDYIEYFHNNDYIVLCSAHDKVRELLTTRGLDYVFVVPEVEDKEIYRKRSDERQPHPLRTEVLMNNWNNFLTVKPNEWRFELPSGEFLLKYLDNIDNMF